MGAANTTRRGIISTTFGRMIKGPKLTQRNNSTADIGGQGSEERSLDSMVAIQQACKVKGTKGHTDT